MFFGRLFASILQVLLIGIVFASYAEGNDEIKNLLVKSIDVTDTASFKTELEGEQHGKVTKSYLIRVFDKNGNLFLRNDIYVNGTAFFSYLMRDGKIYQITSDLVVENNVNDPAANPMLAWNFLKQIKMVLEKMDCRYDMSTQSYKGVPCNSITVNVPLDKDSLEKAFPGSDPKGFPKVIVFLIGKSNHFIYQTKFYDESGCEQGNVEFGKVTLNPEYDPKTFELPTEKELKVARKAKDIDKIYHPQPSGFSRLSDSVGEFFERFGNWIDSNINFLTWVLLLAALGSIGLAIALKLKNRS